MFYLTDPGSGEKIPLKTLDDPFKFHLLQQPGQSPGGAQGEDHEEAGEPGQDPGEGGIQACCLHQVPATLAEVPPYSPHST